MLTTAFLGEVVEAIEAEPLRAIAAAWLERAMEAVR